MNVTRLAAHVFGAGRHNEDKITYSFTPMSQNTAGITNISPARLDSHHLLCILQIIIHVVKLIVQMLCTIVTGLNYSLE